ncbi:MAG: hypothetical protein SVX43_09375 [Cyanobacteriota bacterium]|nr:hypothetical protein [Cyanobacteriota bacterium]
MLKKLGIFLVLTVAGGLVLGYYYWRQLTRVPQWYVARENQSAPALENPEDFAHLHANKSEIVQKVDRQLRDRNAEAILNEQEVNHLIVTRIAEKPEGQKLLTVVRGINTNIDKDKLEIGAVVNPQNFKDSPRLNESEKKALTRAIEKFPLLENREIYVGLESKPQIQEGRIKIDKNAKLEIGELSFTLQEVADRFGVSAEQLVEKINQNLDVLPASEVQFEENELLLRQ